MRLPDTNLAIMARAQGATGIGPVRDIAKLLEIIPLAIEAWRRGETVLIDVRVEPGCDSGMASALIKEVGRS